MVSMIALSGVGVAGAVGAGAGVGDCAVLVELNIKSDATTASALNNTLPRRIAVSLLFDLDDDRRR
jgi:hypothetical protein